MRPQEVRWLGLGAAGGEKMEFSVHVKEMRFTRVPCSPAKPELQERA